MNRINHRTNRRDTVLISGWVYADLLLGLMILFLVSPRGVDPATLVSTRTPTPTATSSTTKTPPYITPTFTQTSSPTPTPTLSANPSPTSTSTPTAQSIGVNQTAYQVVLRVNPDQLPAFFAKNAKARQQVQAQLTEQIRACFGALAGKAKAGFLLAFGGNPQPGRGNELAQIATDLLMKEYPDLFTGVPIRNYHTITTNPYENGTIELQTHFITQAGLLDVVSSYGEECVIPSGSWCQGGDEAQVVVFNWDQEALKFRLNNVSREIQTARGDNPSYACMSTTAGEIQWEASIRTLDAQGRLNLTKGKTGYLYFCIENGKLVQNCRSGTKVNGANGN